MKQEKRRGLIVGIIAILASIVIFLIPFAFILLTASKTVKDSSDLAFSLPEQWELFQNIADRATDQRRRRAARFHQQHHPHRGECRSSWSSSAPWPATSCTARKRGGTRSLTSSSSLG